MVEGIINKLNPKKYSSDEYALGVQSKAGNKVKISVNLKLGKHAFKYEVNSAICKRSLLEHVKKVTALTKYIFFNKK
uniref:Uncharacterized protein n=1 Tax=Chromera velia CCMP2878 TaxID=1169474 RepID=A0A0G4IBG5_9ALVE|eukprot:Cvel_12749.t1-p1 / transcript=Cvel_12749.t1 / gene=Cvel_12749 / organism=Chromera_velia_CCMP2878 / gene_product=hypothetical protein / transcript_product=hypothetical protein / location=Cvel_scaffold847:25101-25328(-) / protein_length=76 / sequence_SO=supercontig / SO=protein_coding / is_pseudo=false